MERLTVTTLSLGEVQPRKLVHLDLGELVRIKVDLNVKGSSNLHLMLEGLDNLVPVASMVDHGGNVSLINVLELSKELLILAAILDQGGVDIGVDCMNAAVGQVDLLTVLSVQLWVGVSKPSVSATAIVRSLVVVVGPLLAWAIGSSTTLGGNISSRVLRSRLMLREGNDNGNGSRVNDGAGVLHPAQS